MEASPESDVDRWAIRDTQRIVLACIGDRPIAAYLFGSRAAGTARAFSDIDVALEAAVGPIDPGLLANRVERLEESTVPYRVDLVDLAVAPAWLRDRVCATGIRWNA